jgi:hypothetical protein
MQNRKKGFVLGILLLFLGASVLPSTSGIVLGKNDGGNEGSSVVTVEPASIERVKQYLPTSLSMSGDLPVWRIGDSWIYALSLMFTFQESDAEISVDFSINNLNFEVGDDTGDSYQLNIEGDVNGEFTITIEGYPSVKGSLKDTTIMGIGSIEQATLGVEELILQIDGRLTLIGLIPIPLEIDLTITFDPSYYTISFPLVEESVWTVNHSEVTIEGKIVMSGISDLFPIIPDEIPIDMSDYSVGGNKVYCYEKESVEVIAGQYTAYNITFDDGTKVYYAAAVGNFISIVPSLRNFDVYELELDFELVSTTYINPEAPNVPGEPTGSNKGRIKTEYTYASSTTDPQGDQVYYLFDWGDGSYSTWLGPYDSGVSCEATHTWSEKGSYNIRVQAKDTNGAESGWSDPLPIRMPCSYDKPLLQFLELLFQRFPYAFPILRQLMG